MTGTDGGVVEGDRDGLPVQVFRRAKPADALDLALATFLGESRVDMQTLAGQLDVSPATLHRWFGSRAQLLDGVLGRLAEQFTAAARSTAAGHGDERVCDYARRVMNAASTFDPARSFVVREPQLGLRLLLGRDGSVHRVLTEQTGEVIAETRAPGETPPEGTVHLIVQVATALVWATFMIGEEPRIDDAVAIVRMILASSSASADPTAG